MEVAVFFIYSTIVYSDRRQYTQYTSPALLEENNTNLPRSYSKQPLWY